MPAPNRTITLIPNFPMSTDQVDEVVLERVMREVPRGAIAVSGLAVGTLLAAWFLMYA